MVCTRDIPEQSENGRERTMAFIQQSLQAKGNVQFFRLRSILEERSIKRFIYAVTALVFGVMRGHPIPLQTLLFLDPLRARELETIVALKMPTTVYLDGVRSGLLSIFLRKRFPELRIVCDFDDLMSRRMQILAEIRAPISTGYMSKSVPRWVKTYFLDGLFGRFVQKYEIYSLASLEKSISAACNSVVLVSSVDAQQLLELTKITAEVIPPVMPKLCAAEMPQSANRFVFIGSDSLLQNRLSIEFLVNLWQRNLPKTELHIFGKQTGQYPSVPGVVFHGFVKDLNIAYASGSVLLAPAFLSGGVKTKVLEALSYGIVPLGTKTTFEGINASFEGLVYSENDWDKIISKPSRFSTLWNEAGQRAIELAARSHSADYLSERWRQVIWPT